MPELLIPRTTITNIQSQLMNRQIVKRQSGNPIPSLMFSFSRNTSLLTVDNFFFPQIIGFRYRRVYVNRFNYIILTKNIIRPNWDKSRLIGSYRSTSIRYRFPSTNSHNTRPILFYICPMVIPIENWRPDRTRSVPSRNNSMKLMPIMLETGRFLCLWYE